MYMMSNGVDTWLKHWLKLQKKNKHPLILKGPSEKASEMTPTPGTKSKVGSQCGKGQYIETDGSNHVNMEAMSDDNAIDCDNAITVKGLTDKLDVI